MGIYYNGSIENTDTQELLYYLDFMKPAALYGKFNADEKLAFKDVISDLRETEGLLVSGLKDPFLRRFDRQSLAILVDAGEGVVQIMFINDDEPQEPIWLTPNGANKRYIGFDELAA